VDTQEIKDKRKIKKGVAEKMRTNKRGGIVYCEYMAGTYTNM